MTQKTKPYGCRIPPAAHLEIDASYEIGHLEMMVENGLRNLGDACTAMRRVESDLQQFLSDYATQVGHLLAELDGLHQQIAEYDRKLDAAPSRRSDTARREEAMLEVLREELPKLPASLTAPSGSKRCRASTTSW